MGIFCSQIAMNMAVPGIKKAEHLLPCLNIENRINFNL